MALFKWLTKDEIKKEYDHYGFFMGLVPIYIGDGKGECRIKVRNGFPDFLLDIALFVFEFIPYDYFMIKQTRRIK